MRELGVNILEKAGYRVLTTVDGEEAIRIFQERADEIDLALLEVIMPKQNGRAVYEAIQQVRSELPVIFSVAIVSMLWPRTRCLMKRCLLCKNPMCATSC